MWSTSWMRRARSSGTAHDGELRALDKDETLRLPRGEGAVLRVRSGSVLVTQEGDPEDHVLGAGEEFRASGRGLAVAWALRASDVVVADALLARGSPQSGQRPATPLSACC